jgi:uncharacterized membrane protein
MSETKLLAYLVIVTLLLGGMGFVFSIVISPLSEGDLAVSSHEATLISTLSSLLRYLATAAVILVPLGFLLIYRWFGREKRFTVPPYLITIPDPALRPWQVNLLFKKDVLVFDESGFYATLLDLHRRKCIAIASDPEGKAGAFLIRILKTSSDDQYEQRVLDVLGQIAENDLLDLGKLEKITGEAKVSAAAEETALRYRGMLADLTMRGDPTLAHQYIVDGRDHIVPFLLTSIIVFSISFMAIFLEPVQSPNLVPATVLWGVVVIQSLIAIAMPSALFGHWKDDKYREKLQWEAFTRFLSDPAILRKNAPEDLPLWGDWLVYGTALGVGDKVESAMAELNISMADIGVPVNAPGLSTAFSPLFLFKPSARGRSGSTHGGSAQGR